MEKEKKRADSADKLNAELLAEVEQLKDTIQQQQGDLNTQEVRSLVIFVVVLQSCISECVCQFESAGK